MSDLNYNEIRNHLAAVDAARSYFEDLYGTLRAEDQDDDEQASDLEDAVGVLEQAHSDILDALGHTETTLAALADAETEAAGD